MVLPVKKIKSWFNILFFVAKKVENRAENGFHRHFWYSEKKQNRSDLNKFQNSLRSDCSDKSNFYKSAQIRVLITDLGCKKDAQFFSAQFYSENQKVLRYSAQMVLRMSWAKKTLWLGRKYMVITSEYQRAVNIWLIRMEP